ncbi:MAG: tail fiber protein [Acidovorax sp.]
MPHPLRSPRVLAAAVLAAALAPAAHADYEPYLAEIKFFAFNFCPKGWAPANGALMAIQQNAALFSLLGVQFGGDGRNTYALPDLQGRTPVGAPRQGAGLSAVSVGEEAGRESVTLTVNQLPMHTHALLATTNAATTAMPGNNLLARVQNGGLYASGASNNVTLQSGVAGGGQPVNVRNPYLGLTACIAVQGVYPSRQ